ncbi:hypothetical protein [Microbulbifer hydrolyticus]|uniref:Uncharacterized protein n=1 Tax=Microbulbifer hydrolyticus TaxID=48074 RepID=A0A6P1TDN9_9GAMM|nr:hypothetical protein [Microbulbifer hydrolyticus]MBB5212081.1 hypothetical protein [Microbulbifer hydrolyticus]QHQ39756.1 hypothetical protein GTQ55_12700 [Microbulbifer hydrolyticus]
MTGIPSFFSPIQLHNRLNRPVWIGFKLTQRGKRQLVILTAGDDNAAKLSKNFETFVGQIVREFKLDPKQTDFVELRQERHQSDEEANQWYRWHAHWVGSAPMGCKADPVNSDTARSYLEDVLTRTTAAA